MNDLKIDKDLIFEKIDLIRLSLKKLQSLQGLTLGQFALDENFAVAEHYLRYALEAMLDICGHILSRMPGAKYRGIQTNGIRNG